MSPSGMQNNKKHLIDLGIVIMPFTHKSNGVLKENDVSFFEEHDVSMLPHFLLFGHFGRGDATPVFLVSDQQSILEEAVKR